MTLSTRSRVLRPAWAIAPEFPHGDVVRLNFETPAQWPRAIAEQSRMRRAVSVRTPEFHRPYRNGNASSDAGFNSHGRHVGYLGHDGIGTAYFEVPYDSRNAITTGDFSIRGRVYIPTTPGASNTHYWLSVQNNPITAAGSAWGIFSGAGGTQKLGIMYCDGATRSVSTSASTDVTTGWHEFLYERYNGTLYGYVNGTRKITQASSITFNVPSGAVIRIGYPLYTGAAEVEYCLWDCVQIKRRSLMQGAASYSVRAKDMYPL